MSVNENPPAEWAMSEACRRVGVSFNDYRSGAFTSKFHLSLREMARLIEQHEEAPVDPVEVAVNDLLPNADMHPLEVVIRTAIKRGIELSKAATQGQSNERE